jgi:hypothetical protein
MDRDTFEKLKKIHDRSAAEPLAEPALDEEGEPMPQGPRFVGVPRLDLITMLESMPAQEGQQPDSVVESIRKGARKAKKTSQYVYIKQDDLKYLLDKAKAE